MAPGAELALGPDLDLTVDTYSDSLLGEHLAQSLSSKGYVVIKPKVPEGNLTGVLDDIQNLAGTKRFEQPPAAIMEGLLGVTGSSLIAELPLETAEVGDADGTLPNLKYFDSAMTTYGTLLVPHCTWAGLDFNQRTAGVLHKAGVLDEDGPALTEQVCAKWLHSFTFHSIMCIWVIGPDDCVLELTPFDEDANSVELKLSKGSFVMLRPDTMKHDVTGVGKETYCLTSFYLNETPLSKHVDEAAKLTPCAESL